MKIALIGYGKMGHVIEQVAIERGHTISLTIDKDNLQDLNKENLKDTDVAVEFTTPEAAVSNYLQCFDFNIPVVSGTTGWLSEKEKVDEACTKGGRFFYASNFSLGVNLFFQINKYVAKLLWPYDNYTAQVEEVHHTQKLDAPSGTAIKLSEGIIEHNPKLKKWENYVTKDRNILPIISKRIGAVPGMHSVIYTSKEDVLTIKHEAKSREGFALGAVLAAEFLVKQDKGWYGMDDLLNL
ncbi:dihydrodipicolinate reductase [Balneicella halophila]|uniref:4-hydroxy-tetrahydrodipicolinate reductase n=1 Tax=Balneicella halophila TaxID=1537566 RepID=A0A7L4UP71_BALHA|nr:4-hydroxy-tetrahydrodipicolinate reductase [Balneicella halophila]PVX50921.1 dihydrodipicolinate reductase [Balneicella halophila]